MQALLMRQLWTLLLLTSLATLLWAWSVAGPRVGPAAADDGAVEIYRGQEGSYELVVRVLPEAPAVGTIYFSVTPLNIATNMPADDVEIVLVVDDTEDRSTYQTRVLNSPTDPQNYEASIKFEEAGDWILRFDLSSAELGFARFDVPLEVAALWTLPGTEGGVVFLAVVIALFGGGVYLWFTIRRRRRAQSLNYGRL